MCASVSLLNCIALIISWNLYILTFIYIKNRAPLVWSSFRYLSVQWNPKCKLCTQSSMKIFNNSVISIHSLSRLGYIFCSNSDKFIQSVCIYYWEWCVRSYKRHIYCSVLEYETHIDSVLFVGICFFNRRHLRDVIWSHKKYLRWNIWNFLCFI